MRRKLAAGNWKMNGNAALLSEVKALAHITPLPDIDILVCPPSTLLDRVRLVTESKIATGGQDCHPATSGAHTGDISADMLLDAGATYVILGHSERRQDHQETDLGIQQKARAALAVGLKVIICLGESLKQREDLSTLQVIAAQLEASVPENVTGETLTIAYEPIWAIGTGKVATLEQIEEVHTFLREQITSRFGTKVGDTTRILYGGSVKAENAAEIFTVPNVDGALVGGASLHMSDFKPIIDALAQA